MRSVRYDLFCSPSNKDNTQTNELYRDSSLSFAMDPWALRRHEVTPAPPKLFEKNDESAGSTGCLDLDLFMHGQPRDQVTGCSYVAGLREHRMSYFHH